MPGDTLLGKSPDYIDPPAALTHPDKQYFTLEITHTEFIDGFEYFVFNEPPYDWPPMPGLGLIWNEQWDREKGLFFAGNKVRLSDDGVLIFRLDGVDVPVFDFSMPSSRWHSNDVRRFFTGDLPSGHPDPRGVLFISRQMRDIFRSVALSAWYRDRLDIFVNPAYRNQPLEFAFNWEVDWNIPSEWYGYPFEPAGTVQFLNGFGMRRFSREWLDLHYQSVFFNSVVARSAVISGKEMSIKEAKEKLWLLVEPGLPPAVVGQRDTLEGDGDAFDFSDGIFRERSADEDVRNSVGADLQMTLTWRHGNFTPILQSAMGIVYLGKIDFGSLVAEGPGHVDPGSFFLEWEAPGEGSVCAVRTGEGGLALMHVVHGAYDRRRGFARRIVFDWVYYPPSDIPIETSIKSISWGELKDSLRR